MIELARHKYRTLDLANLPPEGNILSDSYYYNSLPLCVIDSIYSIGVRYESVINVVDSFCEYEGIRRYRDNRERLPFYSEQYKVSDFIRRFENCSYDYLAEKVFKNNQRTSSRNGILKSQAVVEFLSILNQNHIDIFQDLWKIDDNIEKEIKKITGQASGISLAYFYMLAGNDNLIKPDRMVIRFLEDFLNRPVSVDEALEIIRAASVTLGEEEFGITISPRELDHLIWKYQREQ